MNRNSIGPLVYGFFVVALSVLTLFPAIRYWKAIGANLIRCIFADPACSLTISTYILCAITLLVFIATLNAAFFAKRAFEHERKPIIAIQACKIKKHRSNPEIEVFLSDVLNGFIVKEPDDFHRGNTNGFYIRLDFEIVSAGRSPILDADINIHVMSSKTILPIHIGTLRSGQSAHLTIWVSEILNETLRWGDISNHAKQDKPELHIRKKELTAKRSILYGEAMLQEKRSEKNDKPIENLPQKPEPPIA